MRFAPLLVLSIFLFACQPTTLPIITIIDNDKVITLRTEERVPSMILKQAGITLNPHDRLLLNGLPTRLDQPITNLPTSNLPIINYPITLQTRHAVTLTLRMPNGEHELQTSAFTIGEAIQEASISLHAADKYDAPLNAPISKSPVSLSLTHNITINSHGKTTQFLSSAQTVGEALAEAGIPLIGLDYSIPAENDPIPSDGQIRVVHISESVLLAQKPIPFESELQASADVPIDQTQIMQPGETGLAVQRIRIRYEDGKEVSRLTEDETTVRPPMKRILAYGTKIEVKMSTVDGVNIEYWRAVQMYATAYSPCRSGSDRCYSGTSSGKSLRKGMIGLRYSWYLIMQGQQLYIPGYGFGSVEDVCGGCTGKPWIDLGYSDADFQPWHSWVTVYFLTPVPANVIYDFQ
jgi:uncharacterized protein YabE (DUF348 family)